MYLNHPPVPCQFSSDPCGLICYVPFLCTGESLDTAVVNESDRLQLRERTFCLSLIIRWFGSQINEHDSMKKSRDAEKQLKCKVEGQNAVIKSFS